VYGNIIAKPLAEKEDEKKRQIIEEQNSNFNATKGQKGSEAI